VDDWPSQGYLRDNVDGRLLNPDDGRVGNRISVIKQQDLDFHDIEDGSEAVERVVRTTIAEQMGEGQVALNPQTSSAKSRRWRSQSRSRSWSSIYAVVSGSVVLAITITNLALIILEVKIVLLGVPSRQTLLTSLLGME
jgi:hypothetical protein